MHIEYSLIMSAQLRHTETNAILTSDIKGKYPRITLGGLQPTVASVGLHNFKWDSTLDQVHAKTMAKGM